MEEFLNFFFKSIKFCLSLNVVAEVNLSEDNICATDGNRFDIFAHLSQLIDVLAPTDGR